MKLSLTFMTGFQPVISPRQGRMLDEPRLTGCRSWLSDRPLHSKYLLSDLKFRASPIPTPRN